MKRYFAWNLSRRQTANWCAIVTVVSGIIFLGIGDPAQGVTGIGEHVVGLISALSLFALIFLRLIGFTRFIFGRDD